jgi:AsmA protein
VKKMIYGILGAFAFCVAAAVLASRLVPLERYKPQIVARVKAATGLDLRIGGPMSLSFFPRLEIDFGDVGLSNVPGARAREMMVLERLRLVLKLRPLFSGRVEVDSLVLDQPRIELETDEHGVSNWRVAGKKASQPGTPPSGALFHEVSLADVRIRGGTVLWSDARSGKREQLDAVEATLSLRSLDDPLEAKGELVWRGRKIEVDLALDRPRAWLDGGSTSAGVHAQSETLDFHFRGDLVNAQPPALIGSVTAGVPSISALADWLGIEIAASGTTFVATRIEGQLSLAGPKLDFRKARVVLDDIEATGDLRVDLSASRAKFEGSLAVEHLAIDPYLAADAKQTGGRWSEAPIQLDRLRVFDANLDLACGSIDSRGLKIGRTVAGLKLERGVLALDLREVALYGGQATGNVTVTADQAASTGIAITLQARGCQAEPLLRDGWRFDRLSGAGDLDLALTSRGASERELVAGLRGKGTFDLQQGALRGINLVGMVTHVATAFTRGETDRTEFSEVGGTFTVEGGVVRNDDLVLESPLMKVGGSGRVDLDSRTVDYRIAPKFVAPLVGQLGLGSPGVTTPVLVRGPWNDVRYEPDLAGLARNVVDVPVDVLKGVVEFPGRVLGGGKNADDDGKARNPFKGIFGK